MESKTAFRKGSKKVHPSDSEAPMKVGELGGTDSGESNQGFVGADDSANIVDKRSSLTNAIIDHFKRSLSSASLKSNRSSSTSLAKHDEDCKMSANTAGDPPTVKEEPQQAVTPSRTRKTGYVPGGFVNRGFVDDKNNEPFAILRERDAKKARKPKWQKQLSTFHSEISHQKFNEQQKRTLRAYSSANYMPAHSITYVRWMKIHRANWISRLDIDRWFLISLIGVLVGFVATLLKQCIQSLNGAQWRLVRSYMKDQSLAASYAYLAGTNAIMVFGGAILVTMFHPMAAGGGAPEVIAFLNGIRVHGTLSVKNLVAKFSANVLAVGSGLPAAVQGPLITYGAIIGAGVGQFQSKPFHFSPNIFRRFRNAEDRRTFTTDGVAAGVSAGFHSPIGGLLFAMEDLSSFWSKGLSWQTFFCSVVATSTAQMFNTAFQGFKFSPPFGYFFWSTLPSIQMHVTMYLPAILLGIVGGLLGALFTRVNVFINQKRKVILSKIKNVRIQQLIRMLEPCFIVVIMTAYAVFLPLAFQCKTQMSVKQMIQIPSNITKSPLELIKLQTYANCPNFPNQSEVYYNPMASLTQFGSQGYMDSLWSRNTFYLFDYSVCLSAFAFYFPLTIWTAGSAIAGGIFVPILISGSLIGRALGIGFVHAYRITTGNPVPTGIWAWIDPGVMAAVGAGALLSGVNRLEVASTVILVEMVGDINLILPVLIAIFVSKTIAGKLSKPLYKYQLEGKALPFLDTEPELVVHGKILNMELWRARDIMASPIHTISLAVSVHKVSKLLLETKHNGFPVVKYDDDAKFEIVYGMITRHELYSILSNDEVYRVYHENTSSDAIIDPKIAYEDMDSDGSQNVERILEILRSYTMKKDINTRINLELYVNMSVTKVDQNYSLMRTYRLFRTMGLRQLLVTDNRNRPVGMITRKDLMQFNMQEKLEKLIGQEIPEDSGPGSGIPRVYSGGQLGGRRMSRRFSVEEGSVLGVVVAQNDGSDGNGDAKDEAVIELPAVTRIRKMQMETIREEEASSTEAEHSPVESETHLSDESFNENGQERKTSFTVVKIEGLESDDDDEDDAKNNDENNNKSTDAIVSQHPHLEQLYMEAIKQADGKGNDNNTSPIDKPTQRF